MKAFTLALFAVLAVSAYGRLNAPEGSFSWSLCTPGENASDKLQNLAVTVSPNPPVKGQNVTISGSGSLTEDVTGGKIDYSAEGIISGSLDLCTELGKTPYPCPLKSGSYNIGPISFELPSIIPSGLPLTAKATITDQSGAQMTCIEVHITL